MKRGYVIVYQRRVDKYERMLVPHMYTKRRPKLIKYLSKVLTILQMLRYY